MKTITLQLLGKMMSFALFSLAISFVGYAQVDLSNPGDNYSQNFNTAVDANDEPDLSVIDWTFENSNSDDRNWTAVGLIGTDGQNIARGETGLCAGYPWSSSNAANDWLFSPQLVLNSGSTYRLTFYYAALNAGATVFPEKFKVSIGSNNAAADMTTDLQDFGTINNTTYQQASITFTVPSSGNYYIGWQAYSDADQYWLRIDDVEVINVPANDVAVQSISLPNVINNECGTFSASTQVDINVANLGSADQPGGFQVTYEVSNSAGGIVTSGSLPVASLNTGANTTVSFNADLSAGDTYTVTASTTLGSDDNTTNDENVSDFLNPKVLLDNDGEDYTQGFESSANLLDFGWSTENVNGDSQSWQVLTNANFSNSGANFAICFRNNANVGDDWLFSNCLDLVAGQTYRISFFRRANGGETENLSLHIGNAASSASMTTEIAAYNGFSENAYTLITEEFTVPTSGIYHLGWHMTSPNAAEDGSSGVMIDDVRVLAVPANDIAVTGLSAPNLSNNDCSTFSASTDIEVTISNLGSANQSNVDINYTVVGNTVGTVLSATETVTTINAGDEYTFTISPDLSVAGETYTITITNQLADAISDNDEIETDITNPKVILTNDNDSYNESFDYTPVAVPAGWGAVDANGDGASWGFGNSADLANSGSNYFFILTNTEEANNDWLFSNCIELEANKLYNMSFFYRTNASNQNLSISLGQTRTVEAMTRELFSSTTLQSEGSYTEVTLEFAVATAGVYHIGFHSTSPAEDGGAIRIDDFTLTNSGTVINLPNAPSNLTLEEPALGSQQIALDWDAPSITATEPVDGYVVERSTDGTNFSVVATGVTGTSYTDNGLNYGTPYIYRVAAQNVLGLSGYSNEATLQLTANENTELSQRVQVYPNPSSEVVKVDLQNLNTRKVEIELLNARGEVIARYPEARNGEVFELNLAKQAAGLYLLRIATDKGIAIKKLIRE